MNRQINQQHRIFRGQSQPLEKAVQEASGVQRLHDLFENGNLSMWGRVALERAMSFSNGGIR
jgi:hypothetical protein